MKRREFIAVLGGMVVWPLAAHAQRAKLPTIGFMGPLTDSAQRDWTAAFLFNMRRHGWVEGDTVAIVYRWAEGRTERFAEIAAELVQLKVNVIVTAGTLATIAAKQATTVIPIVFGAVTDAVGSGLVANLPHPGGNVTGLTMQQDDTASKRIELLRDVIPNLRRVRSWPMWAIPELNWRSKGRRRQPERSGSEMLPQSESDEQKISRPPSRRLKEARTHSLS